MRRSLAVRGLYVYFPFSNQVIHTSGELAHSLYRIGFGVHNDAGIPKFFVQNPEALKKFGCQVQEGSTKLPPSWSPQLKLILGGAMQEGIDVAQKLAYLTDQYEKSVVSKANTPLGPSATTNGNLTLSPEQDKVASLAETGHHLYIAGSAGSGKTVVLREIHRRLALVKKLNVAMTASTGLAATAVNGSTFHYHFGNVPRSERFRNVKNLLRTDALVLDEVSMLSAELLEAFDTEARLVRQQELEPFGGIQVILCGDFMQLKCIEGTSLFKSPLFLEQFVKVKIEQQQRQDTTSVFYGALQACREGVVTETLRPILEGSTTGPALVTSHQNEEKIQLYAKNAQAKEANLRELAKLPGDTVTYDTFPLPYHLAGYHTKTYAVKNVADPERFRREVAMALSVDEDAVSVCPLPLTTMDEVTVRVQLPSASESLDLRGTIQKKLSKVATEVDPYPNEDAESLLQNLMGKHAMCGQQSLKVGARVMVRHNLTATIVNGSIGVVTGFAVGTNSMLHPKLGCWVTLAENLRLWNVLTNSAPLPIVKFEKLSSVEEIMIPPVVFVVGGTLETGHFELPWMAVPLLLGYAFTMHKVQGMTLEGKVCVDLNNSFQCAHLVYVALSRVRQAEQLEVRGYTEGMVTVEADALEFDKTLPAVENVVIDQHHMRRGLWYIENMLIPDIF